MDCKCGLLTWDNFTLINWGRNDGHGCCTDGTNVHGICLSGHFLTGCCLCGKNKIGCCILCTDVWMNDPLIGCCCFSCPRPKTFSCCFVEPGTCKCCFFEPRTAVE